MGADSFKSVSAAAGWAGLTLDSYQTTTLVDYHRWLGEEAMRAGGIGPYEVDRLWRRHIADSLLFSIRSTGIRRCLDIGSGVGLPGIPLAVCHPETEFHLVDRSGRRCDLMRRAIAVLGLANCTVDQQDIGAIVQNYRWVVSRAAIPPREMMIHVKHLLEPGGIAVLGLTWGQEQPDTPKPEPGLLVEVVSVPPDILDTDVTLLRIEAT